MSESALKFGPEWLRNLSQGTNVSSPPPSPGLGLHAPKFKLAEFRYGREEMLAIFPKDIKMPPDLKQFTGMHKEQYQLPVTLVALTEEEQKIWTRSVNSDAVLRLMGKGTSGAPAGVAAPRGGRGGGSVDRGRGRGRATYFQRGPSLEDGGENAPPGIFTRQRSYERPNTLPERGNGWEERERRYEKGFASREEESIAPGRKENSRGNLDWRSSNQRDRDRDGEDDSGWRVSGLRSEKWGRTAWRSERGEHDDPTSEWASNGKAAPRKSNSRPWNDDHPGGDLLPEWSTEDNRVADSVGTFDATGAFMETKDDEKKVKLKEMANNVNTNQDTSHQEIQKSHATSPSPGSPKEAEVPHQPSPEPKKTSSPSQSQLDVRKLDRTKEADLIKTISESMSSAGPTKVNHSPVSSRKKSPSPTHKKEEVNFEHLEKAAESLVDNWTAEEDEKVDASHISNSTLSQWYYRDPQGIIQGPFSDSEMAEWFRTGYFNMSLLVRRGLEGRFFPLGELVKQWGCVPFLSNNVSISVQSSPPAPVQPPQIQQSVPAVQAAVLNDLLGPTAMPMEHQNDLTSDHEQQLRILQQQLLQQQLIQQQHMYQQQQQQQQMFLRQQLQQVMSGLKPTDGFSHLTPQQQQQHYFLMQRALAQQHPPGVVPRPAAENNTMSDPVRQFFSQLTATQPAPLKDDSQTLWNMQTRTPRAEAGARWAGMHPQTSVWDVDTSTVPPRETVLGPSHMHLEVLEQEKKLMEEQQKKRLNEEEMLRKQEEEHRRRQLEEEERIREELRRREEEEERIRVEELLRQQREMEERKQKEAEERRLKEQELRRLQEEEKRRQEQIEREREARIQHELRQEEERANRQRELILKEEQRIREESRRKEEEKQRLEEEKLKSEHQRELQRQLKAQQQEAFKLQQKQQKSKSQTPAWGGQTAKPSDNSLSLAEIQKLQEEKERQERIEWEMQQHLIQQQMQQQQQQAAQQAKAVNLTWANRGNSAGGPVKSLLEIQQEEADKLAQEQEKEQQVKKQQQQANNVSLATAGVWSNANNHLLRANSSPSPWNFENSVSNSTGGGFWDDSVTISNGSKVPAPTPNKTQDQRNLTGNNTMANGTGQVGKSRMIRARKEEETVMKLFEGHAQNVDEFSKWCSQTLRSMQSTVDVPTFVSFLKEVESPYEVYDYVKMYIGESKEALNFAKQFLEKRSKYRNQDNKKEENMWGPAPAITPSLSKLQPSELEGAKVAGAKRKKKRMQKLDNTILGFTVHASMDRVNVGDIDHGEDI